MATKKVFKKIPEMKLKNGTIIKAHVRQINKQDTKTPKHSYDASAKEEPVL